MANPSASVRLGARLGERAGLEAAPSSPSGVRRANEFRAEAARHARMSAPDRCGADTPGFTIALAGLRVLGIRVFQFLRSVITSREPHIMRVLGSTSLRPALLARASVATISLTLAGAVSAQDASGVATSTPPAADPSASTNAAPAAGGASASGPAFDPATYAVLPEGKTLPADTFRLRLPFRFAHATKGFDEDGHKTDIGAELRAVGTGIVLEYGVNEDLSLQIVAPIILQNDVGVDAGKFRNSSTYKKKYAEFTAALAAQLQANGFCTSTEQCLALIESGQTFPSDTPITLPTGETFVAKAGTPMKDVADSVITNAAKPSKGRTGLGDIQIGALYAIVKDGPVRFSAGGGFRFPTGSFKDVPSGERPTGRGTLDGGIRTNVDILPTAGVVFSWQNQNEFMLAKGKREKSSLLDPSKTNDADPTSDAATAAGSDGKSNNQTYERVGARNVGFVRAAWGLGSVVPALMPIGLNVSYNYDVDGQSRYDGVASGGRPVTHSVSGNIGISGLAYSIPASVDFDYDQPFAGRNLTLAPSSFGTTIKVYYRF
jgi:hypothetical protein